MKLWENESTMMNVTLEDIENSSGRNPIVINIPVAIGVNLYISQHIHISMSILDKE